MYKVKGIGKETTISSKVNIFHEGGKITKVEDKWDGKLPDSGIANVSKPWTNAVDPRFWANYWLGWSYSLLVFVHDQWWWMVRGFVIFLDPRFSTLHPFTYPLHLSILDHMMNFKLTNLSHRPSAASTPSPSPKWSASPTTPKRTQSAATSRCHSHACHVSSPSSNPKTPAEAPPSTIPKPSSRVNSPCLDQEAAGKCDASSWNKWLRMLRRTSSILNLFLRRLGDLDGDGDGLVILRTLMINQVTVFIAKHKYHCILLSFPVCQDNKSWGISRFQIVISLPLMPKGKTPSTPNKHPRIYSLCIVSKKESRKLLHPNHDDDCFPQNAQKDKTPKMSTTIFQCFASCTSRQYLTNAFLCTSPTNLPSRKTQMYRSPNFTKHSYTKSMGEQISSDTGAASM
jgi:hypothetical protein